MSDLDGVLPFKSSSGSNVIRYKGYYFIDGKITMVDQVYDDVKEWSKIVAYIIILNGEVDRYIGIDKKDMDTDTKELVRLLKNKAFNTWVNTHPIEKRTKKN